MVPASNLLAYVIGAIALIEPPWVAVALTVTAVLLLGAREKLHRLIHVVPREELITAGMFLILVGIILPLVPHEQVTSLTPLTPYGVWLAVVTVCTLSYLSYLLQRYAPIKHAALLPADPRRRLFLDRHHRRAGQAAARDQARAGGYLGRHRRGDRDHVHPARRRGRHVRRASRADAGAGAGGAERDRRRPGVLRMAPAAARATPRAISPCRRSNPLQIPAALIFAALIVVISIISAWVKGAFGESGILALSAVVGLTDIDPFVLNIAQGGIAGMSLASLCAAVLIAASSNNVAKAAYAIGFGGAPRAVPLSCCWCCRSWGWRRQYITPSTSSRGPSCLNRP